MRAERERKNNNKKKEPSHVLWKVSDILSSEFARTHTLVCINLSAYDKKKEAMEGYERTRKRERGTAQAQNNNPFIN